ncbi:MAG: CvpA family protein [Clostridiales bacterium]|nr:CvpA family protein [Clostridiales bacterium]
MLSTIGLIIDAAIIVIVLIFGIIGLKKGFLKSILSLFSWIVCIAVAVFTTKYVTSWINGIFDFSNLIGTSISNTLQNTNEFFARTINSFASKDEILSTLNSLDINSLLKQLVSAVFSNTAVNMESAETVGSLVGASLGHICMLIITAVLIFIVLKLIVALLYKLFDNIERIKILGGLNKILGLVLGVLKAGIIVIAINCMMVGLSLVPTVNNVIKPVVENTHIEKFVYTQTNNVIEDYVIEGNVIQEWISGLWESRD